MPYELIQYILQLRCEAMKRDAFYRRFDSTDFRTDRDVHALNVLYVALGSPIKFKAAVEDVIERNTAWNAYYC